MSLSLPGATELLQNASCLVIQPFVTALSNASLVPRSMGKAQRARLVENLELDAVPLRGLGWSYPSGMPPGRGANLTNADLMEASNRLNIGTPFPSTGALHQLMTEAVKRLSPSHDAFCRSRSSASTGVANLWCVMRLNGLRFSWPAPAHAAFLPVLADWFRSPDPSSCPARPESGNIRLGRDGDVFWLGTASPLTWLAGRHLATPSEAAALAVIQELALPGFETPRMRQQAVGLVAVEFAAGYLGAGAAPGHAWKPTALDALGFKGYDFLPAHASQACGHTWPLLPDLRRHAKRDGLPEFIHPNILVPASTGIARHVHLLGFLDPAAQAQWQALTTAP